MGAGKRVAIATAAVGGATATAVGVVFADPDRRARVGRTLRVWRLLTRRAVHYAAIKTRAVTADEDRRRELDEEFLIHSAADVARELGQMKGVVMKAGQMLSFLLDGLPEAAQQSLASLQSDAPPMAPSLAAQVVRDELGGDPRDIFLEWEDIPVAAASIGQVHRAVTRDGRQVAVKVQYPGIDRALGTDLANAELLYAMFSSFALKSLDVKGLVDELRVRMLDELDYRLEASCQSEFAARYAGHPFVRIPRVVEELSTRRVLTSEWVDGLTWAEFLDRSTEQQRQAVAEVLFRFVQGSIYRDRVFNGDPHPGNYRFHLDGTVTFFDFGLVKRWAPGELETLAPLIDPLLHGDGEELTRKMVEVGFLAPDHGLDPHHVLEYVVLPYRPYLQPEYTFPRDFTSTTMASILDVGGPYADVIAKLNMPSSFVILDRVVWGMSALMGRLAAHNRWREILDEYRFDAPPATPLGRLEATWRATRPSAR